MPTDFVSADAEVRAILADPAYTVPPAAAVPPSQTDTLAWLRALVARFCDGAEHDRRRELVERDLADLDPVSLRSAAADLTAAMLVSADAGQAPFDAMTLARRVPVAVLAAALGIEPDAVPQAVDAVLAAASGYPNPDQAGPGADAGVGVLTRLLGPADPERLANRIGLLMQACDATAGLIGNALITAFAGPEAVDDVVARTVRDDPPVLRTRRLSPAGEVITVDLSGCTFGAGRRPCPGADQATALAAGVLDAILPACELADQQIGYLPSPNLRIPAELMITLSR
jgi:cytochrome P450